jgi:DEAD/DEAH box helicase domain-containing protein
VRLADDLLADDIQTVLFGRTRRTVEMVLTYLRQQSGPYGDAVSDTVRGYRGGYLPNLRREIENGLRSGQVRAVVATNALELGMDIGGMGAAVLIGYPGSIAAAWQQAGRAGRGQEVSAAVLVATADPLDQYLCRNPDYFFDRTPEQALINPDNPLILLEHLRCAAFELPFTKGEKFGSLPTDQLAEYLEFMVQEGVLHISNHRYYWMADNYPAQKVSLRSASSETVVLQVEDEYGRLSVIGQVEAQRAAWLVHSGAVYLHEAQSFIVRNLDLENKTARLFAEQSDYYTEPRGNVTVSLVDLMSTQQVTGGWKYQGEIQLTHQITGFRKLRWYTHEMLGFENLDLPPSELLTTGYWVSLSEQTVDDLRLLGLWRGDPNDYGPDWPRLTELVRSRDGYRCQVCSRPESQRAHDVHHKIPLRVFAHMGGPPPYLIANRLENLVTLCSECHRRAETAVRVRSGLAGLGYALGHIAPLFLMCDPGDLGVHSDPQSPLAEGSPSVLIYDQIPAGIGFSQRLYEIHTDLLRGALDLVAGCSCSDGCPSCVGPGGENGLGGRQETLAILRSLTSQPAQAPSAGAIASDQ